MLNFNYSMPTEIFFGKYEENRIGEIIKKHSRKVLLHYGNGSIHRSGLYRTVVKALSESGVEFIELGGVMPNPRLSLVKAGIDLCRKNNLDFVLAVGGGSVIDSAKAIAAGVAYDGDVWDFFDKTQAIKSALGVGVILTIAAAGSETSRNSVITNEDGWIKTGVHSDYIVPKFAIMNPELTYTLPSYQTACGCADIFAHLMERYFSPTPENDYTDRLIEASMKTLITYAPIAYNEPENYNARAQIMFVGSLGHNGLLDCGRIGDWASHNIEHQLSACYDIAHGAGLSIVFPAWMKYVYKNDLSRFMQFAIRVFGIDIGFENIEEIALSGIYKLECFFKSLFLPVRLSEININSNDFELLAQKAVKNGIFGQFALLDKDDVMEILELAK